MSHNIEGKVVVITGASSGLGEATAQNSFWRRVRLWCWARAGGTEFRRWRAS